MIRKTPILADSAGTSAYPEEALFDDRSSMRMRMRFREKLLIPKQVADLLGVSVD